MRTYQAAIEVPRKTRIDGKLQQVIEGYNASQSFFKLAPRTRTDYEDHLTKIEAAMLGWTVSTVNEMLDRYQAMTAAQSDSAVKKLEAMR